MADDDDIPVPAADLVSVGGGVLLLLSAADRSGRGRMLRPPTDSSGIAVARADAPPIQRFHALLARRGSRRCPLTVRIVAANDADVAH